VKLKKLTIIAVLSLGVCAFAAQQIKLNPGATSGKEVHTKSRNLAFCEIVPVMGNPPIAEFYNTTGVSDCPADKFDAIDAKKLAQQVGADSVFLNPRRHWVMDQMWCFKAGEDVDFDGVKATWMATMPAEVLKAGTAGPYTPMEIHRSTKYLFEKGKPVYLLTPPDGKVVYVMQAYTNHVEKSLDEKKLGDLGTMLKLPAGWTFKVKTLDKDLTIDPRNSKDVAHIVQDNILDTYEGCGFDATCNYTP
jgi:hypothetical protein